MRNVTREMRRWIRRSRRGAAAVEFTMLVPVMTTMLLGTMEYSNWYGQLSRTSFVARDVGRYAANLEATDREDKARAFAEEIIDVYDISCERYCEIDVTYQDIGDTGSVEVVVRAGYDPYTSFMGPLTPEFLVGRATFPVTFRAVPEAF